MTKLRIYLLTIKYYLQQNLTDWKGAKQFAEFIVINGWKKW